MAISHCKKWRETVAFLVSDLANPGSVPKVVGKQITISCPKRLPINTRAAPRPQQL